MIHAQMCKLTEQERLRKLEEDLQNKHHQSLKAIEARNAAYQDRLEKKLGG